MISKVRRRPGLIATFLFPFVIWLTPMRHSMAAADTPNPPAAVNAEARRLYEQGLRHYERAEYDQAIQAFEASYDISRAPGLLFNIGQAYRLSGDCPHALSSYEEYLARAPATVNRERVETRIRQMADCVKASAPPSVVQTPAPVLSPPEPPPSAGVSVGHQPRVADSARPATFAGRHHRAVPLTLLGTSLALGLAGAWFLATGTAGIDETTALFESGGTWDQASAERQHDARTKAWVGLALLGGATLSAVGAAWTFTATSVNDGLTDQPQYRRRGVAGATLAASAVALGVAGTFFLVRSHSTDSWISDTFQKGGVWDQNSDRLKRNAVTDAWVGSALVGGAAIAAVTGGWLLLSGSETSATPKLAIGFTNKEFLAQCHATF